MCTYAHTTRKYVRTYERSLHERTTRSHRCTHAQVGTASTDAHSHLCNKSNSSPDRDAHTLLTQHAQYPRYLPHPPNISNVSPDAHTLPHSIPYPSPCSSQNMSHTSQTIETLHLYRSGQIRICQHVQYAGGSFKAT